MEFNTPSFSSFFIGPSVVLPLELVDFKIDKRLNDNVVVWKMLNEKNTKTFVIERSLSLSEKWQIIGKVNAIGNSSQMQTYEWKDEQPLCFAYYRLRSIDIDAATQLSKVISVQRACTNLTMAHIYPNPVSDNLTIEFESAETLDIQISVYDGLGRSILQQKQQVTEGGNRLLIDLQELPQGIYILTIFDGKHNRVEKFLKY